MKQNKKRDKPWIFMELKKWSQKNIIFTINTNFLKTTMFSKSSKNQIVEWKVYLPPIEVYHNITFYQSNLWMIVLNEDSYFLETWNFSRVRNSTDVWHFANWRSMYQQENRDEIFTQFIEFFQHATIRICDSSIK